MLACVLSVHTAYIPRVFFDVGKGKGKGKGGC